MDAEAARAEDPAQWATGRLLSTAARLVEHAWDAHLSAWGLNHASFAVLAALCAGPLSQRELADLMQVKDQTMSRTLERLERTGHVRRERSGSDRRRVVVRLTGTGRRAVLEAGDPAVSEGLVSRAIPAGDLPDLRRHLVRLVEGLGPQRGAPRRLPQ